MKVITANRISSKGIAIGNAFVMIQPELTPANEAISELAVESELLRFHKALQTAESEIGRLVTASDIFAGHRLILTDHALMDSVTMKIRERKNAEQALTETMMEWMPVFEIMKDEYMKERAADIKDVCYRILRILKGVEEHTLEDVKEEIIVVARELTPSDVTRMDPQYIKGIITELGSAISHASILASSKGIPAVVGVTGILQEVEHGETIILDTMEGRILLSPDLDTLRRYEVISTQAFKKRVGQQNKLPAVTPDGRRVELCVNVGSPRDMKKEIIHSSDGIGLFRSEALYMESDHFPTEEEQFLIYSEAAKLSQGEITIRTLDIGGDKVLSYYRPAEEENPFLGLRGIRVSLVLTDIFKTQLRAILRAAGYGRLKLMFPMITTLEEFFSAKQLLEQCKQELRVEGLSFQDEIEVGIMVETPAAVINMEDFAKHADFFSIGTNDLTQYLLAADRNNPGTASLCNSFYPAVLRSLHRIIETGHRYHKKIGMCGEMAGDPGAIRLLLGMGLDSFSMSPAAMEEVRDIIRCTSFEDAKQLAEKVLQAGTLEEVIARIKEDKINNEGTVAK